MAEHVAYMGGIRPFIFAACDEVYYEKYGIALASSARANGHECEIIRSGRNADLSNFDDVRWHAHWRYKLLPDILDVHPAVLMLDADSVVRKPIEISEKVELGLVVLDLQDIHRNVNGGCVYITSALKPLAIKISGKLHPGSHWFEDQMTLFRLCVKRGNYRLKKFGDDFFSWRCNPGASIWTGKGKNKSREAFVAEVAKWK